MNLQEFKKSKPEFIRAAKNCKSESEFTSLAERHGIKFGSGCLEKAYKLFCGPSVKSISEKDLVNVAGGRNFHITQLGLGGNGDTFIITL